MNTFASSGLPSWSLRKVLKRSEPARGEVGLALEHVFAHHHPYMDRWLIFGSAAEVVLVEIRRVRTRRVHCRPVVYLVRVSGRHHFSPHLGVSSPSGDRGKGHGGQQQSRRVGRRSWACLVALSSRGIRARNPVMSRLESDSHLSSRRLTCFTSGSQRAGLSQSPREPRAATFHLISHRPLRWASTAHSSSPLGSESLLFTSSPVVLRFSAVGFVFGGRPHLLRP